MTHHQWLYAAAILAVQAFILFTLVRQQGAIMDTQAAIDALTARLADVRDEIITEIETLQAAAEAGEPVDLTALTSAVNALDDVVPDVVAGTDLTDTAQPSGADLTDTAQPGE